MIGRLVLGAALALAAGVTPPRPAPAGGPGAAPAEAAATLGDRLGWNAYERTRTGLARLAAGEAPAASEAFDTALRLRPDDPVASYNAGTGRLAAGRADALAPLEAAARAADPALAPDAWYNLGNARLAAGDPGGAVEAYAETLRRASDRLEAKKNLELALRELERQHRRPDPPPAGDDAQRDPNGPGEREGTEPGDGAPRGAPGEAPPRPERGATNGADAPERAAPPDASASPDAERDAATGSSQSGPDARARTLRDFRDQPDLDAEQAAALLAAVENLERQQRRERALDRARTRRSGVKDW